MIQSKIKSIMESGDVMEVWKSVRGFPRYEVSNTGRVRSKPGWRAFGHCKRYVESTILKPRPQGAGYFYVTFWDGEKTVNRYIHRLVAAAFIGPSKGREVNHIDGRKDRNHFSNLEWVTRKENCLHRARVLQIKVGENHGMAKLSAVQVANIRADKRNRRIVAAKYEVAPTHIDGIRARRKWNY